MDLFEFIALNEDKQVQSGLSGKFEKVETKEGPGMAFITNDKAYVISASLSNPKRFAKWEGQEAEADIKETGKKVKTTNKGKLPLIQIKTEVQVRQDNNEKAQPSKQQASAVGMSNNEIVF